MVERVLNDPRFRPVAGTALALSAVAGLWLAGPVLSAAHARLQDVALVRLFSLVIRAPAVPGAGASPVETGAAVPATAPAPREAGWEPVWSSPSGDDRLERLRVDGGWLYRSRMEADGRPLVSLVFVPADATTR